jgi:hypothetical protein
MKQKILFAALMISAVNLHNAAHAQAVKEESNRTKLEAFAGTVGAVSIKGYVEVGTMKGTNPVTVSAMVLRDAKSGKVTSGAVFEITETKSYGADTNRSYVDAEELSDLLSGLTYISQADATVTPMRFFEARYSTRGGLTLTVFNDAQGQRQFSVHVGGNIGGKNTFFRIQDLPNFWDLIAKAKEVIENPEKLGKIDSNMAQKTNNNLVPNPATKRP